MIVLSNVLTKQNIGIAAAALFLTTSLFVPGSEALPREGVLMLGVFGMAAILWICESLPVGITGLLALTLATMLGIAPLRSVFRVCHANDVLSACGVFFVGRFRQNELRNAARRIFDEEDER